MLLGLVFNTYYMYNTKMNFIKRNWHKLVLLSYAFFIPVVSLADSFPCGDGKLCNPLGETSSIPELIKKLLEGALKIGIPIIALAIIYSGFLFVFARGNSEKLGKAKETLMYTLIGAAILLGSLAIAEMIQSTVGAL